MSLHASFTLLKRNSNYRRLYIGQFVSLIGNTITNVALPYQIYHETHSTLMVGLLSLFQLIPLLFTALLGGVLADRYHRRTLLIVSESLLMLGCLMLLINLLLPQFVSKILVLFIVAMCMSAITGLHRPALESITQQIVHKSDFPTVGALITFKYSIGLIAGPALGGVLIATFGLITTYSLDFITYLISLITLLMIDRIPKPELSEKLSTWKSFKQGIVYAFSRQELLGSYLVDFTAMIFAMPMSLFPAIAHQYGSDMVLGLLYSAPAVGALFISFSSGWARKISRHGAAIAVSASLWGFFIILFGLQNNFWLALGFLCIAGAFDAVSGIFRQILWNETIPMNLRGRLAGIEMISYLSGPKLGDTIIGFTASFIGITATVISGGGLSILGILGCCYFMPKFIHYKSSHSSSFNN